MDETGMDEILGRVNGWNRIGLLWGGARGWSLLQSQFNVRQATVSGSFLVVTMTGPAPGSWGGVLCPLGPGWKNPAFWSHLYLSPVQPLLLTPWCAGKQTILSVETEAKKEREKN